MFRSQSTARLQSIRKLRDMEESSRRVSSQLESVERALQMATMEGDDETWAVLEESLAREQDYVHKLQSLVEKEKLYEILSHPLKSIPTFTRPKQVPGLGLIHKATLGQRGRGRGRGNGGGKTKKKPLKGFVTRMIIDCSRGKLPSLNKPQVWK